MELTTVELIKMAKGKGSKAVWAQKTLEEKARANGTARNSISPEERQLRVDALKAELNRLALTHA